MIFGIPAEIRAHENRVGAVPFLVEELIKRGHQVLVESRAGEKSHYTNEDYQTNRNRIYLSEHCCRVYRPAAFRRTCGIYRIYLEQGTDEGSIFLQSRS